MSYLYPASQRLPWHFEHSEWMRGGVDLGGKLERSAVANRSTALGVRPTEFESRYINSMVGVPGGESFNLSEVVFLHLENG